MTYTHVLSSSSLCSDDIKNPSGETLGSVKDIMIDTETGQVQYYVMSFGGFLGMGDKLFAIPPQAITVDTENECLVMDVTKEILEDAPGFDKDHWPNMADVGFRDSVYDHYGYKYKRVA